MVSLQIQDLGLRQAYLSDNDTHRYLKKLTSLPFLPHQHIPAVFDGLKAEASTDQLTTLVEYLEATWILDATWTPDSWSVYFQSIRTNNDVEGWHFRLNNRGRPQVQLYLLVSLLHQEAIHISNQVRLVSDRKLKRMQKKKYCDMQAKTFKYWEEYECGERSAARLLCACSRLVSPV
ncbi:uncharacterized protein LOC121381745 [Gigantopelta aegis]|uniref:uncharacterized protein LOC121381745 n=1 Tax=Gigantopelta aegis TaxID=1735272 RepID=UPI001B88D9EF|nr:uncharacterized protein LOC121381745 [Gigantopelta aegis]